MKTLSLWTLLVALFYSGDGEHSMMRPVEPAKEKVTLVVKNPANPWEVK